MKTQVQTLESIVSWGALDFETDPTLQSQVYLSDHNLAIAKADLYKRPYFYAIEQDTIKMGYMPIPDDLVDKLENQYKAINDVTEKVEVLNRLITNRLAEIQYITKDNDINVDFSVIGVDFNSSDKLIRELNI